MSYDVGDLWTPELTVKNDNGVLTNATVVCTTTSPTGIAGTPSVTHASTGVYTADVLLDEAGAWTATWTVSGAVTGVEEQAAFARALTTSFISVEEIRTAAGNLDTATMSEADIQGFIDAATVAVERWIGPVIPRTVVETSYGNYGSGMLLLQQWPVVSITGVTEGPLGSTATTVDTTNYELDPVRGALLRIGAWYGDRVTVTYVAGRTVIGEHIRKAATNHVLNAIRRQRSSGTATFGDAGFTTAPEGLDNIVRNDLMLDPYYRAVTIA